MLLDKVIYPGNTMACEVQDAFNRLTKRFVGAGATGTLIFRDSAGAQVAGVSWPVILSYVPGSRGVLRGLFVAGAAFVPGDIYSATISITYAGVTSTWTETVPAALRN